ncbi:MAG: hypothetical protein BWY25_01691 [Chloroflexi bacterium ADurb.Bin222]|nr:MAG: hypothetical protein BWY25_01691 [Chloroflexi bacterium ADurb.Bin222]
MDPTVLIHPQVVGDKGRLERAFHHGMPPGADIEHWRGREGGTDVVITRGDFRQRRRHIEPGQRRGECQQLPRVSGHLRTELAEQPRLQLVDALLGIEHQAFVFFELRRDVALRVDQRLFADVIRRHGPGIGVRDLDVVAKDLIVAHLQGLDARARAFLALQGSDPLTGVPARQDDAIEFGGKAGADEAAAIRLRRGVVYQRRRDERGHLRQGRQAFGQRRKARGRSPRLCHEGAQLRHRLQRGADADEVTRRRFPRRDAIDHPLQVGDWFEETAHGGPQQALFHQPLHLIQARLQGGDVKQRTLQPVQQQSAAHRRQRHIEHPQQRTVLLAAQGLREFQIAPRRRIHRHEVPGRIRHQPHDLRQHPLLRLLQIRQDRAGSPHRQRLALAAEALQRAHPEMFQERLPRGRLLEAVSGPRREMRRQRPGERLFGGCFWLIGSALLPRADLGEKHLTRLKARQFLPRRREDVAILAELGRAELAGGNLRVGDARAFALDHHSGEVIRTFLVEQCRLDERAGRDNALDAALHRPTTVRLAYLLGKRHTIAFLDEAGDVVFYRMIGHPRHRNAHALRHRARGEDNIQLPGHQFGVGVEGLIEIAQPEEQDSVRIAGFQFQILLADGGRVFTHTRIIPVG